MRSLVLLDGYNLLHRGCAVPALGGAKYVIRNLFRFRSDFTHGALVLDSPGGKNRRREIFEKNRHLLPPSEDLGYKAKRGPKPVDFFDALATARTAASRMGYKVVLSGKVEADDVLATLARKAEEAGFDKVLLVTRDQDLYGAVSAVISIFDGERTFTLADFDKRFGFRPRRYPDFLALKGKPDQVPGVRGIGEVGAKAVVQRHGTLRKALKAANAGLSLDDGPEKLLRGNAELARLGYALAQLDFSARVPDLLELAIKK